MKSVTAFFLGIFTVAIPFIIFYILSLVYVASQKSWDRIFCSR